MCTSLVGWPVILMERGMGGIMQRFRQAHGATGSYGTGFGRFGAECSGAVLSLGTALGRSWGAVSRGFATGVADPSVLVAVIEAAGAGEEGSGAVPPAYTFDALVEGTPGVGGTSAGWLT